MIQRINNNTNSVLYYVAKAEADDPEVESFLKREITRCKQNKHRPVIMLSGSEDLIELTSGLLVTNRNRMTEREVKAEREAAAARMS